MSSPFEWEVGVDLSKDKLDISLGDRFFTCENNPSGLREFLKTLRSLKQSFRVSCEATGAYSRLLLASCLRENIPVSLPDARGVRDFAKASGQLAKTDKIDARVIAGYAKVFNPKCLGIEWVAQESLRQLHTRLEQIVQARAKCKTSLEAFSDSGIRKDIREDIASLERKIKRYGEKIDTIIKSDVLLEARRDVMKKEHGIGPVTSGTLLIEMPELGTPDRQEVAALAGLAPMNRDSGKKRGRRKTQDGRAKARRAIYLAALASTKKTSPWHAFYKHLRTKGKAPKVALVAVARKLLIHLNSQLKNNPQFTS